MLETKTQSPLACDLNAITRGERETHILNATQLFQMTTELRELPDGYALRLPDDTDMLLDIAKFIEHERECCPFFRFAVELEPEGGPLWLELGGRVGVKDLLRAELGLQLKPDVARAANLP